MDTVQEAKGILADAEKALRDLMQRELHAQRYTELADLARLADGLARLSRSSGTFVEGRSRIAPAAAKSSPASEPARNASPRRTSTKAAYPRFERDSDRLIKVGWSKKRREEYEHRAPRSSALAFTEHLGKSATIGVTFVIDDLLPAYDSSGDELPSYQVYLAVAWLRHMGAVEKRGRNGYVVVQPLDGSAFDLLWEQTRVRT